MENQRETKTITAPSGKTVVLKAYITGREKREITKVFLDTKLNSIDQYEQADRLSWKTIIVSIDGKTDNVVDLLLDLPAKDYEFIKARANDVVSDKDFEEKKTS